MGKRLLLLCAVFIAGSTPAFAHGFAIYVSTPVSPPRGFEWIPFASLAVLVLGNVGLQRFFRVPRWLRFLATLPIAIVLFAAVAFWLGRCAASGSTAPPPGLGSPYPVFWGFGWSKVGGLFVFWNGVVFLSILAAVLVATRPWKDDSPARTSVVLLANAALYLLCLAPFLATGALTYGWAGGYVSHGCDERIEEMEEAAIQYARDHDGFLPAAQTLDEFLIQIEPHRKHRRLRYDTPLVICPLGAALDKEPRRFEWNRELSGKRLRDVRGSDLPVRCPYHEDHFCVAWSNAIMEPAR